MSNPTVNHFYGLGRLTSDPKLKPVNGGDQHVCEMRVAFNRPPSSNGEDRGADFLAVEIWGARGQACAKYLTKGRPVLVEGRVRQNAWKDDDDNWHERILIAADSVSFLGAPGPDTQRNGDEPAPAATGVEDDIPF